MKIFKKIKDCSKKEDGVILLAALVLLGLGALIIAPLLSYMNTGLNSTSTYEVKAGTQYAAEAGVEQALWHIKTNGLHLPDGLPDAGNPILTLDDEVENINGSGVNIEITYLDNTHFRIVSTATNQQTGSSSTIEAFIAPTYTGGDTSAFNNAITALDDDINIIGSVVIRSDPPPPTLYQGNIHANGNITGNGSAAVYGDASASGTIDIWGSTVISGETKEGADSVAAPEVDVNKHKEEALDGGTYNGNLRPGDNDIIGPLYINGDLKITGSKTIYITGTIYVAGEISMTGNCNIIGGYTIISEGDMKLAGSTKLDAENIPFLVSTGGDIDISGSSGLSAILYAMNGDIKASGSSTLYGCAVANNIKTNGSAVFEYPIGLRDREDLPSSGGNTITGAGILSWMYR